MVDYRYRWLIQWDGRRPRTDAFVSRGRLLSRLKHSEQIPAPMQPKTWPTTFEEVKIAPTPPAHSFANSYQCRMKQEGWRPRICDLQRTTVIISWKHRTKQGRYCRKARHIWSLSKRALVRRVQRFAKKSNKSRPKTAKESLQVLRHRTSIQPSRVEIIFNILQRCWTSFLSTWPIFDFV